MLAAAVTKTWKRLTLSCYTNHLTFTEIITEGDHFMVPLLIVMRGVRDWRIREAGGCLLWTQ